MKFEINNDKVCLHQTRWGLNKINLKNNKMTVKLII